jgi:hypothetical protein
MGQYHILVNVDKREYLNPGSIGLGVKQWEHQSHPSWPMVGSLADAMYVLTMTSPARGGGDMPLTDVSGRWAGDRVMVVGDYTEDGDLPPEYLGSEVYETASSSYTEIGEEVRDAFTTLYGYTWEVEEFGGYDSWTRHLPQKVSA